MKINLPARIIIGGQIASGTSTTAKTLAQKLNYTYIDVGQILRALAKDHGMNIIEFQEILNNDKTIDKQIEEKFRKMSAKSQLVINGKITPWYLHKHNITGFYIYLHAPLKTRINRIRKREPNHSFKSARFELLSRERQMARRYRRNYNLDRRNISFYNMRINTAKYPVKDIVDLILAKF